MFEPVSTAGLPLQMPLLRTENTDAAVVAANMAELKRVFDWAGQVNGTVQLPAGNIFVETGSAGVINLSEYHAGITIRGAGRGKTVLIPVSNAAPVNFASRLVGYINQGTFALPGRVISNIPDITEYEERDTIYFWRLNSGATRSDRQRLTVFSKTGNSVTLTDDISTSLDPTHFKHIKGLAVDNAVTAGAAIPAGSTAVKLFNPAAGLIDRFVPGDDVLLGDGPGLNEFFGEWLRVAAIDTNNNIIYFDTTTVQTYAANLACLVPGRSCWGGRRQHMTDILIRDMIIAAPSGISSAAPFGILRAGVRLRFENVAFVTRPDITAPQTAGELRLATCGRTSFRDAACEGTLVLGASQDVVAVNVTAGGVRCQEYAKGCAFIGVLTTGAQGFTMGPGKCARIDLTNCTIRGYAATGGGANVSFADDSAVTDVRIILPRPSGSPTPPPVVITAARLRLTNPFSDSPFLLAAGSSGVLIGPVSPPGTEVTDESGFWLQPLMVGSNGVVRVPGFDPAGPNGPALTVESPAAASIPFTVRGATAQSADLTRWLASNGTPLFGIRADGNIATAKFETAGTGPIKGRLALYNMIDFDEPIGYVQVFDSPG